MSKTVTRSNTTRAYLIDMFRLCVVAAVGLAFLLFVAPWLASLV